MERSDVAAIPTSFPRSEPRSSMPTSGAMASEAMMASRLACNSEQGCVTGDKRRVEK